MVGRAITFGKPARGVRAALRDAALLGAALAIAPAVGRPESLTDAIQMAYASNPAFKSEQASLAATNEDYAQARSNFGPQVSATGGVEYQTADVTLPPSLFSSQPTNQHFSATTETADLSLTQPLYTFGQNRARLAEASATILAGRQSLRQAESKLLLSVITAYADVLRDREIVRVVQASISDLAGISDSITAQGAAGELSKTDVAQAESRLLAAKAQLVQTQTALSISTAAYLAAVGQNPGELEPMPELAGAPDNLDEAFDTAEHNSPDLRAAEENERLAHDRINEAKSAYGPNISLQVDAGVQPYAAYIPNELERSITAAVVFKQPIFTSGMTSSVVRQAVDRDNSAELQVEATRRQVIQQVSQAWDQLTEAHNAFVVVSKQLDAEQIAYEGNVEEEKAGLRSTIDLLNAQLEYTNSRVAVIQDRHDEYVARATLIAAVGALEADRLTPGPHRPDPIASYGGPKARLSPQWDDAIGRLLDEVSPATPDPHAYDAAPAQGGGPSASGGGPISTRTDVIGDLIDGAASDGDRR
ncbi:MAG TPA: TolC family outer membrane protein [Caulobacteraceae bacterium]|nr:TolC family outer membrane protein [Caulobacteraceae bacterium]